MHRLFTLTGFVLLVALPSVARPAPVLTLGDVLARARESAPAIIAGRMRIEEARGRVIGASLLFPNNPTIDVEAGRRSGRATTTDYGVEVAQGFDLPARRRARLDAARAGLTQEEQRSLEIEREVLREAATAFLRAVEARERSEAVSSGKKIADEMLQIAERRYAAGDVAQLDVNLARTFVARAESEARLAAATFTGHATRLKVLLGIAEAVTITGSLRDALLIADDDLVARSAERPDLRLLDSEVAEAEAERRLAGTFRWPELELRGSYRHEEGDRIVLGGVGLSLPIFNRGQEAVAVASARHTRLRLEREALARTIDTELRGALAAYEALRSGAADYERTVLPLIEENERLALESYEVGQTGLADLLIIRREAIDARRTYIDQLIETRLAEVELRAHAGVWK